MSQGGYDEDARGIRYEDVQARAKLLFPKAVRAVTPTDIFKTQIGGTHYKDMVIQPFEFCHRNNIGHLESTAIGYLSRWRSKGGIQDLEKAVHAIQYLIEMERSAAKGGA